MDVKNIINSTITALRSSNESVHHSDGEIHLTRSENGGEGTTISRDTIDRTVNTLNGAAAKVDNRVSFSYNEKTRRIIMRVQDSVTDEVVKQIPSKDMVKILENINEMIGIFVDEQR